MQAKNNYILQKLSLDEDKKKIWSKNRFYSYLDLIHEIEKFRKLIKKKKIKKGSLIGIDSDFNFKSISFFSCDY